MLKQIIAAIVNLLPGSISREAVEAALTAQAAKRSEHLDWRNSIVDLMKLLNLDSSLTARERMASELGYTGAFNGSAEMNIWLHERVMQAVEQHSIPLGNNS